MQKNSVNLYQVLRRLPFTLLTLALLCISALLTNTHAAQLPGTWMDRLGFAPADLTALQLWRLFTSAIVTSGGRFFWQALVITALAVGWAEWRRGPARAALVFWGVHLLTLLILSLLIALPLHWMGFSAGTVMALARDVGPSAGYFGALGLDISSLRSPWRRLIGGIVLAGLIAMLLTPNVKIVSGIELSADLAHLIAFPLGWIGGRRR